MNYEVTTLVRINISLEDFPDDVENAEATADKIIESLYDSYDGVKNVEIVDWDMIQWQVQKS